MVDRQFKLRGRSAGDFVEFFACPEISDHSYHITVAFAGYTVQVTSVTLWSGDFLQELAALEATRSGRAELCGTYDFAMTLEPFERRGDVLVRFVLAHPLILPTGQYGECRLNGALVVEGEYVSGTLRGMEQLLRVYR